MTTVEPLITTNEVARQLSVSAPTVNRWRSLGIIEPVVEIGATVRWDLALVIQGLRDHYNAVPKRPNPKTKRTT